MKKMDKQSELKDEVRIQIMEKVKLDTEN